MLTKDSQFIYAPKDSVFCCNTSFNGTFNDLRLINSIVFNF